MKQIRQFRYYDEDSPKNQPQLSEITSEKLTEDQKEITLKCQYVSGAVFANYMPVIQLGIQGLPGTKFYLNGANQPVIIGMTGIYELDLDGLSEIDSLSFDYDSMTLIEDNENAYLIVDIIWDDGEG